jgi:hypothetical protein
MKRSLTLRREALTALSNDDLTAIAGGGEITGRTCLHQCIETTPARCYWATFDNC